MYTLNDVINNYPEMLIVINGKEVRLTDYNESSIKSYNFDQYVLFVNKHIGPRSLCSIAPYTFYQYKEDPNSYLKLEVTLELTDSSVIKLENDILIFDQCKSILNGDLKRIRAITFYCECPYDGIKEEIKIPAKFFSHLQ
jgi:transposase